jgi:hypothetical protein
LLEVKQWKNYETCVSLLVMIHVNRDTVVPFQVRHLGADLFYFIFQKTHFDNKNLIIYEILAINIGSFFGRFSKL